MGLLDNYSGIGMSPRPKWQHQLTLHRATSRSFDELEAQGLTMLTEATVTNDWDDLAPDLVIFDKHFYPLTIIEVTTKDECGEIIKKCYELIDRFDDSEFFVYDYENNRLFMYKADRDIWLTSDDFDLYSIYLNRPLIDYLKP